MKQDFKIIFVTVLLTYLFFSSRGSEYFLTSTIEDTAKYFIKVEIPPTFPGGMDSLQKYFKRSIILPKAFIYRKLVLEVYTSVLIDSTGSVSHIWINDISTDLKLSVTKSILEMPKWKPGIHNGVNVNALMTMPIIILDYERGIWLDTISHDKEKYSQGDSSTNILKPLTLPFSLQEYNEAMGYRYHSVFYDKARRNLDEKNFKGALKNLDDALVSDPYDIEVLRLRAVAYRLLGEHESSCSEVEYVSYLSELSEMNSTFLLYFGNCDIDFKEYPDLFLSNGLVIPSLKHKDDINKKRYYVPPSFPGGLDSLYKILGRNFNVEEGVNYSVFNSRLLMKFRISKDGTLSNPDVFYSYSDLLVKEAYRLFNLIPKWNPATVNNEPVEVDYIFPIINFKYKWGFYFDKVNFAYNKGVALFKEKKYTEALESFDLAIKMDSLDFDARYNRGLCNIKLGNKKKACEDWSINSYHADENALNLIDNFCDSICILDDDTLSSFAFKHFDISKEKSFTLPSYPGGEKEMNKFVFDNLGSNSNFRKYEYEIWVGAFITKSGKLKFARVMYDYGKEINEEALRIVNLMPAFIPSNRNDVPVDVFYVIQIHFKND